MTRSTNMKHVEALRVLRERAAEWGHETENLSALDAAIAALSAPQPPAEAQPVATVVIERGISTAWHYLAAGLSDGEHDLYANPPPSAPVGVEAYLVERLTGTGYGRARSIVDAAFYNPTEPAFWIDREAQAQHRVTPLVPALAQQPAPSATVGAEVASLPALWRLREDNGEEHSEYDKGFETASDECARMLEDALAQQPAAVDEEAVDWHVAEGQCIASVQIARDGTPIVICYGRDHPTGRYVLAAQQGGGTDE